MAAVNKVQKLVDEIKGLSVLELSELVKTLQDELGVQAAPVAAAPAAGTTQADQEGTSPSTGSGQAGVQTVVLTNAGVNKIAVIKALREINPNLGLKEAKDMTEKLPAEVLKEVKAEEAKAAAEKLQAAGATIELS